MVVIHHLAMTDTMTAVQGELEGLVELLLRSGGTAQSLVARVQALASAGTLVDDRPEMHPAATVATVVTMLGSVMKATEDALRFADRTRTHLAHLDTAPGSTP